MGELRIMGSKGDQKVIWDPKNKDEVDASKITFDSLIKKGFKAFKVDKKGDAGSQIRKFDPKAGKIILVPEIVGG